MTNLQKEWAWGATVVVGTLVAVLIGFGEAAAFTVTMLLVAMAIGHLGRTGALDSKD